MYSTPKRIGILEVKNRFIRSATFDGMARLDGHVSEKHLELYKNLAEGGVGMIITGYAYVQKSGQAYPKQLAVYNDEFIEGLSKIAETIHKNGDNCLATCQIVHCGRQSHVVKESIAPSAVLDRASKKTPREMTIDEITETIDAFAQAIRRVKEAGFDAVQLHGAHGYLISSFLSPYTNIRTDEYGGTTLNRVRILKEIYDKSVELVGNNFPILIKMNGDDFLEGGVTSQESTKIAKLLSEIGFAAIEVSGAMNETSKRKKKDLGWTPNMLPESRTFVGTLNEPAYNLPSAKEIKKVIDIPVILVGGINSLDLVDLILNENNADFISFCRPLIREPDLPNRWLKGMGERSVECIYCNSCLTSLFTTGIRCVKKDES